MALCLHENGSDQCGEPCARPKCGHACWKHDERGCDHGAYLDVMKSPGMACECTGFVLAPSIEIEAKEVKDG